MLELNQDLSIYRVPVGLAKPQEVNARYMSPRELKALAKKLTVAAEQEKVEKAVGMGAERVRELLHLHVRRHRQRDRRIVENGAHARFDEQVGDVLCCLGGHRHDGDANAQPRHFLDDVRWRLHGDVAELPADLAAGNATGLPSITT